MIGESARSLGEVLKRHRVAAGLTQEELAARSGLSARGISDLERGLKQRPQEYTLGRLAQALRLSAEERAALEGMIERRRGPAALTPSSSTNLPVPPTPFIGRQEEVEEVLVLVRREEVRLLTLTGPGGVGKTRLALQAAGQLLVHVPDGVWFVPLGSLADPCQVPASIAGTLGIRDLRGASVRDDLIRYLQAKTLLLVLDNFEHVLPASDVISLLLARCPNLSILVTSRTVLHLAAEHEYPVPPLALPLPGHLPALGDLARYDAIHLFVQRAEAVRPAFRLTKDNAAAVAAICHRLDGLPLAIELAAGRLKLFPVQALLDRLPDSLSVLTGGARDLPARQQTLRATIDWSYSLLSLGEQHLLARLSVFAGGGSFEAVEAVCKPDGGLDLAEWLASLVDHSLLRQEGEEDPRLGMLETIREYAAERLAESGAEERLKWTHARYFLGVAEQAASQLAGPDRLRLLDRLEAEHDNLRAALRWVKEQREADCGFRLAIALGAFWEARGYVGEGRRWLAELLTADSGAPELRAGALKTAAWLARVHHDWRDAYELLEQRLGLAREVGDQHAVSDVLIEQGWMLSDQGDLGRAVESIEQGLQLARSLGDKALISPALYRLSRIKMRQGDAAASLALAEESLELARQLEDRKAMADGLSMLFHLSQLRSDMRQARDLLEESMALLRRPDVYLDADGLDWVRDLGFSARDGGEYEAARTLWQQAVAVCLQARDLVSAARLRIFLALSEREQGQYERARSLLEESLTVCQELQDPEGQITGLIGLADLARDQGDAAQTIALSEQSLALARERADRRIAGYSVHNLAAAAWRQGDYSKAERLLAEALSWLEMLDPTPRAEVLVTVGLVALDQAEYGRAAHAFTEGLESAWRGKSAFFCPPALEGVAGVAVGEGRMDRAARLLGAADALRSRIGIPLMPLHRPLYDRHVAAVKAATDEEQLDRLWNEGKVMTVEQAVAYALAGDRPYTRECGHDGLLEEQSGSSEVT